MKNYGDMLSRKFALMGKFDLVNQNSRINRNKISKVLGVKNSQDVDELLPALEKILKQNRWNVDDAERSINEKMSMGLF